MPNSNTPRRPEGLSGQEEEELRALEKGYDDEAGALPDPDTSPEARHEGAEKGAEKGAEVGGERPPARAAAKPLKEAERHGLLPAAGTSAPPLDFPDDEDDAPVRPAAPRRPAK
jgi:hypothetical protein